MIKINAMTQARLIKLMLEGIYSCQELADETGLHYVTVLQYARELHKAGAAHITSWEKDSRGRDVIKVYKIGEGKDARRQRMTPAQRQQRLRDKQNAQRLLQVTGGAAGFTQAANGRLNYKAAA